MSAFLLQLPQEVLLEIIELLYDDYRVDTDPDAEVADISWLFTDGEGGWRRSPLEALRLYECLIPYVSNIL